MYTRAPFSHSWDVQNGVQSGSRMGMSKNLSFLVSEGPKIAPGCPKAPKRVSQEVPTDVQNLSKSTKILPEATPDAQGYPKGVKCTISGHPGVHFGTILDENANKSWASDLKLSRWKIPAAKKMRAFLPTSSWSKPTLLQAEYLDIHMLQMPPRSLPMPKPESKRGRRQGRSL